MPSPMTRPNRHRIQRQIVEIAIGATAAGPALHRELARPFWDRAVQELGTVDILVNNAGAAPFMSSFDQTRLDGYEKYFKVNFLSAVYCTKAAAPTFPRRSAG